VKNESTEHFHRRAAAIILITGLLTPETALPWGREGHSVSAQMAEERLSAAALAAVRGLLEPGQSLADIANWADEQRQVPESVQWHYVDVPISEARYDAKFCQPRGCVVSKIIEFRRVLQDTNAPRAERQLALKFLVHLVPDLHQPLHVGDDGDRGGNLLQVRFFGTGTNLHLVWDAHIIEWHSRDESHWLRELDALAAAADIATWSGRSVEDWANESLAEARGAHRIPGTGELIKSGTRLDESYYRFALPVVQHRLAQSGVRLAAMLNEVLK
jgi:hypothetical protein